MSIPTPGTPGKTCGDAWEPPEDQLRPPDNRGDAWETAKALPILTGAELLRKYPERRPAVIEGLLRDGETMNVIAAPKVGKSWLTLGLAFAVQTGRPWLETFATRQGNVLLIDNELHPETSAHRLRTLAGAMGLPEVAEAVSIVNLRGHLMDLPGLGPGLRSIGCGRFNLVILDAFYRTLPSGADENSNATMAMLYNQLDSYADALGAAFVLIHHTSKGSQTGKAVTDVGSGAGAQSRATDTHLVLRPHEEPKAVVLEASVRSWAPVPPLCLQWDWPLWRPAPDLDPTALYQARPRRRNPSEGKEPVKPAEPPWTAKRFADAFGRPEPRPRAAILEDAQLMGLSDRKGKELLKNAVDMSHLFTWKDKEGRQMVATVRPQEPLETPLPPEEPPKTPLPKSRKHRKNQGKRPKKGKSAV